MASNLCQWNLCEESFDSHKELINHVHSVHINANSAKQTGKFLCKWKGCFRKGKGFDQRCKLVTHARTHTEERPFFCETCQKQFIRHENLKIHMRTHTGDRPYVCPEPGCEKAFSNTSDRTRHTKTHRTQKPYVCKTPGCAKKYTDAGSLRKHARLKNHLSSNVDHHQLVRNNASHSVVVSSTNKLPTTIQKADSAKKKKGIHSQSVLNLKVATSTDATHYFHKSTQTDAILFPQLSSITPRNNDLKMVNPAVCKSDLLDTTGNGLLDLSHTLNENDVLCLGIESITSQNLTKRDHANIKDSCLLDIPSISTVADRDDMFLARVKDQGKCSGDVNANPVDLPDCFADCGSFTLNQCKPAGLNLSKGKDVSVGGKLDQSCCSVHICDENVAVPVIETPCSVPYSTTPSKSKTPVKNSKCDILPYTTYPEDINLSNYLFGNNDYVLDLQVSCLNLTTVKNLSLNNKSEPISETGNCAGLDSLIDTEDITNTLVSEVSLLHDMNDVNSCEHSGTLGFVPTDQNSDLMLQDTGNDVSQAQSVMSSLTHERTKNNADSLKLVTPISLHNDNPLNCLKPLSSENTIAPLPYNSYSNLLVNYISEDCNPMLSSAVLKGSCLSVESSLQSNALNLTLNSVELEHGCVGEDNMDIADVTASQEVPLDLSTGQIEEFFPQTSPALLRRSRRKVKRLTLL